MLEKIRTLHFSGELLRPVTGRGAGGRRPQPRGRQLLPFSGSGLRAVSSSSSFSFSQEPGGPPLQCFLSLSQSASRSVKSTATNPSLSRFHPTVLLSYTLAYFYSGPSFSCLHFSRFIYARGIIVREGKGDTFTLVTVLKH